MTERVSQVSRTRGIAGLLLRSLVIGLGYVLATIAGGALAQTLGLPPPQMVRHLDETTTLATTLLSGFIIGLGLGPLSQRIRVFALGRGILLFTVIFVVGSLINVVEALFFTTVPVREQVFGLVTAAVGAASLAMLLTALFPPASAESGLIAALRSHLRQRLWLDWTWRLFLAGLLYVPIYFLFGVLVSPLVLPYYNDPSLGLELVVPGPEVILPLEVGRGLLYAVTLFPLAAALHATRQSLTLWLWVTVAVLGAITPMLQVGWWPLPLRLTHGLEITADAFFQALVVAWLLGRPPAKGRSTHLM